MNKREKIFFGLCNDAGLKVVEWSVGHRVGGLVEAPNGCKRRFSMAASAGADNPRGDDNLRAELRRFARENQPTALSAAITEIISAPIGRGQRTFLRPSNPPAAARAPEPAPAPAAAPAPINPTAAAPAPAPAPTAATTNETTNPQPATAMSTKTEKTPAPVKLGMNNYVKFCDWLRSADLGKIPTIPLLCEEASKALGFRVPYSSAKEAIALFDIKKFQRPPQPPKAAEAQAVIARAVRALYEKFGEPVPSDLEALAA